MNKLTLACIWIEQTFFLHQLADRSASNMFIDDEDLFNGVQVFDSFQGASSVGVISHDILGTSLDHSSPDIGCNMKQFQKDYLIELMANVRVEPKLLGH